MHEDNEKIIESWQHFLDLRTTISIELGRTELKVRDILELGPASIVRLSRSTGEGVDVRADNHSLMRGEIIVIEDHAGVRVSEITTREN